MQSPSRRSHPMLADVMTTGQQAKHRSEKAWRRRARRVGKERAADSVTYDDSWYLCHTIDHSGHAFANDGVNASWSFRDGVNARKEEGIGIGGGQAAISRRSSIFEPVEGDRGSEQGRDVGPLIFRAWWWRLGSVWSERGSHSPCRPSLEWEDGGRWFACHCSSSNLQCSGPNHHTSSSLSQ